MTTKTKPKTWLCRICRVKRIPYPQHACDVCD